MYFATSRLRPRTVKHLPPLDKVWPLISRAKHYDNKNILNLSSRDMFRDILPDNSGNSIKTMVVEKPQWVYAGFDPTAGSLHVGNLVVLKNLMHWQRSGHNAIILIGSGTAQIGDPSSSYENVEPRISNVIREQGRRVRQIIESIFRRHEETYWNKLPDKAPLIPVKFVNNEDWYKDVDIIKFLNGVGKYFRMGNMLSEKNVHRRIYNDGGLSFAEFAYQIFQAYDWYHLLKNYGCRFQVGGEDQIGNIKAGYNFINDYANERTYGFILPLITNDAGDKFGKSVPNALWLDSKLTSYFDFYQFFVRVPDSRVELMLKLLTFLSLHEIRALMKEHWLDPGKRVPQYKLAEEVTLLVHGEEGLKKAKSASDAIYNGDIEAWSSLDIEDLRKVLDGATIIDLKFGEGYTLKKLVLDIRCFLTEADAIRISEAGGLYVNLQKAKNLNEVLLPSVHILSNGTTVVRVGKRNYWIVKWIPESF